MSKTKTHAPWRTLFALLMLWLVAAAASPQARPDRDEGQYQIVHARYGTPDHNVDVTARLKELARNDTQFRLANATFGIDPAYGETKTLRVYTRGPDGHQRIFDYREGSFVDGNQFTGWKGGDWGQGQAQGGWNDDFVVAPPAPSDAGDYRILYAVYGTAENNIDVTAKLKELARQDRTFRMGNDTFGVDPDYGRTKTLRIFTRDRQGQNRTFEYAEGHAVDGAQFVGWGRGEWGGNGEGNGNGNGNGNCRNLRILRAMYGAGTRQVDVTNRVQGLVRDDRLSLKVTNAQLGADPAPGDTKSLDITWCAGGKNQQTSTSENGFVNVP
ncbi:MAG: hypothetical protein ABJD97_02980 [Betaproteobacteria bacterium]